MIIYENKVFFFRILYEAKLAMVPEITEAERQKGEELVTIMATELLKNSNFQYELVIMPYAKPQENIELGLFVI